MSQSPDDFTDLGQAETFAPDPKVVHLDPHSKEGRRQSERALLRTQPNSLRQHLMDLPKLHGQPVPSVEYMVDGWIPRRAVTIMTGLGGGGKTTIAMQLAAATAAGREWMGLATKKAKSLAFLTEDPREICHIRAANIAKSMGLTLADLPDFKPLSYVQKDSALIRFDRYTAVAEVTHVYNELRALCFEGEVQLLILDALHGLFDGNENDRPQARTFCAMLTELAQEIDGAVVLLSHPSKSSSQDPKNPTSGSTSWHGGVRAVIHVSDPEEMNPDNRTIRLAKANYGRVGEKIQVTWRDGVFWADTEPTGVFKGIRQDKAERVFLDAITKAIGSGIEPSPYQSARDKYAPRVVAARGAEGLKEFELARAMNRLIDAGQVVIVTVGPPTKQKSILCPKDLAAKFEGPRPSKKNAVEVEK